MGFYSAWPALICTIVFLFVASTRLMKPADSPPTLELKRVRTLDGLRAFLALAVFFHHSAIYHDYLTTGVWQAPPSRLYRALGPLGVSMFFMITGYLFWGKLIKDEGRPDWTRLYVGRLFRISPLYLVAVGTMLAVLSVLQQFKLHVGPLMLAKQLTKWLAFGLVVTPHDINGVRNADLILAQVTWSIHYEWLFYASLPLLAVIARHRALCAPFTLLLLLFALIRAYLRPVEIFLTPQALGSLFLFGMLTASVERMGHKLRFRPEVGSAVVLLLLGAYFIFPIYSCFSLITAGLAFYLISSGCSLFGLLTSRAAIRLGDVSYGIYLLQGLALSLVMHFLASFALASSICFWLVILLSGLMLIFLATASHVLIEMPCVEVGRKIVCQYAKVVSR